MNSLITRFGHLLRNAACGRISRYAFLAVFALCGVLSAGAQEKTSWNSNTGDFLRFVLGYRQVSDTASNGKYDVVLFLPSGKRATDIKLDYARMRCTGRAKGRFIT